ncbi:MAG: LysR substrate-binding domain-containing protein [Paracoccus sp. (in: a-proteobacteria)]|nr:LysR substrate-binding domain-containing protein [Paracoccus sp. (in: a-proteobacteria)]
MKEGFDAGIRLGEAVDRDMIALRISPDLRMATIATSGYLDHPGRPHDPRDLIKHNCVNLRYPSTGVYAWEFQQGSRELRVRVEGQIVVNNSAQALTTARAGVGIAYIPEDLVQADLESGRLERVLEGWCPPFSGFHLYYPSRRQHSRAFALFLDMLRQSSQE